MSVEGVLITSDVLHDVKTDMLLQSNDGKVL